METKGYYSMPVPANGQSYPYPLILNLNDEDDGRGEVVVQPIGFTRDPLGERATLREKDLAENVRQAQKHYNGPSCSPKYWDELTRGSSTSLRFVRRSLPFHYGAQLQKAVNRPDSSGSGGCGGGGANSGHNNGFKVKAKVPQKVPRRAGRAEAGGARALKPAYDDSKVPLKVRTPITSVQTPTSSITSSKKATSKDKVPAAEELKSPLLASTDRVFPELIAEYFPAGVFVPNDEDVDYIQICGDEVSDDLGIRNIGDDPSCCQEGTSEDGYCDVGIPKLHPRYSTTMKKWFVAPIAEEPVPRTQFEPTPESGADPDGGDCPDGAENIGSMSLVIDKKTGSVCGVLPGEALRGTVSALPPQTQLGGERPGSSSRVIPSSSSKHHQSRVPEKRKRDPAKQRDDDGNENEGDSDGGSSPRRHATKAKLTEEPDAEYVCPLWAGDNNNWDKCRPQQLTLKNIYRVKAHCKDHLKLHQSKHCGYRSAKKMDKEKHEKNMHETSREKKSRTSACPNDDKYDFPFGRATEMSKQIDNAKMKWIEVFKIFNPNWRAPYPSSRKQPQLELLSKAKNVGQKFSTEASKPTDAEQLLVGVGGSGLHTIDLSSDHGPPGPSSTTLSGPYSSGAMMMFIIREMGPVGWKKFCEEQLRQQQLPIYNDDLTLPERTHTRKTKSSTTPSEILLSPSTTSFNESYAPSYAGSVGFREVEDSYMIVPRNNRAKMSHMSNEDSIAEESPTVIDPELLSQSSYRLNEDDICQDQSVYFDCNNNGKPLS